MADQDDKPEEKTDESAGAPEPKPTRDENLSADEAGTQALSDALKSSFGILKVLMIGLLIVFLGSGFFTVGTQEKAIILRFGRPVGTDESALLGPGPHFAFPYPIDEVVRIPINEVLSVSSSVGWYQTTTLDEASGTEPPPGLSLNPATDGYVLTGDGNIIHVRGTLRFRIQEPGLQYVFDFFNASNQVLSAFNNAIIHAAARFKVDDALTRDTAGFRETVRRRLEALVAVQGLGIVVEQIELRSIPPRQLTAAFEEVLQSEVKRSQGMNEARSYANEAVSKAKANAAARINAGENERNLLVEFLAAEATNFVALLPAYERNPSFFREQRLAEVMEQILTNAQMKVVIPEQLNGRPVELRLLLNRGAEKPRPKAEPAPKSSDHH